MKKIIPPLLLLFHAATCIAQADTTQQYNMQAYLELTNFLLNQKLNSTGNIPFQWNPALYQKQFEQWYTINRKKELTPAILVDNRYVIQTMPVSYDRKDLRWISPAKQYSYRDNYQYKNLPFGEQVATDIIYNAVGNLLAKKKYHYRYSAAENNKPYSTPSFLKF